MASRASAASHGERTDSNGERDSCVPFGHYLELIISEAVGATAPNFRTPIQCPRIRTSRKTYERRIYVVECWEPIINDRVFSEYSTVRKMTIIWVRLLTTDGAKPKREGIYAWCQIGIYIDRSKVARFCQTRDHLKFIVEPKDGDIWRPDGSQGLYPKVTS